jgi:hypothetical protein
MCSLFPQDKMELNQHQIELLGEAMHIGLYLLKPLAGLMYDLYGPQKLG